MLLQQDFLNSFLGGWWVNLALVFGKKNPNDIGLCIWKNQLT